MNAAGWAGVEPAAEIVPGFAVSTYCEPAGPEATHPPKGWLQFWKAAVLPLSPPVTVPWPLT
jgi:hypothetical protein